MIDFKLTSADKRGNLFSEKACMLEGTTRSVARMIRDLREKVSAINFFQLTKAILASAFNSLLLLLFNTVLSIIILDNILTLTNMNLHSTGNGLTVTPSPSNST
ncbi:hypothetical protein BDF21DRAFT_453239 [Thamnidium elegans]|nr:hypothetical protein BDF21DRAFT_453239 [Thamnidium elegans]